MRWEEPVSSGRKVQEIAWPPDSEIGYDDDRFADHPLSALPQFLIDRSLAVTTLDVLLCTRRSIILR